MICVARTTGVGCLCSWERIENL